MVAKRCATKKVQGEHQLAQNHLPASALANNGFILICAALVLLMTPALGLFYAGFVRGRKVLNTLMMSFGAMALVSVLWMIYGYSLAFSPGSGPLAPFIGGFAWVGRAIQLVGANH